MYSPLAGAGNLRHAKKAFLDFSVVLIALPLLVT
jgi:hypothetical protein